jgi:hypothetical protein
MLLLFSISRGGLQLGGLGFNEAAFNYMGARNALFGLEPGYRSTDGPLTRHPIACSTTTPQVRMIACS